MGFSPEAVDLFAFIRELVDIESISDNEEAVGNFLFERLSDDVSEFGGHIEKMQVAENRFNVFAWWGDKPTVTFSTHMDTVPPYLAFAEDETCLFGRGSCDAKGIMGAMVFAIRRLLRKGIRSVGILIVVGEEKGSAGAQRASQENRGSKYLINGEPTSNTIALGSKGVLRYELRTHGRMAHSAYPELGESAIDKLLDALQAIRSLDLPSDPVLGQTTVNIGTIKGGRATNVIPDEAIAEILVRLVNDRKPVQEAFERATAPFGELKEVLCIPAVHLSTLEGFETSIVKYTTDVPVIGANWGVPFLVGPGTIHVAHTDREHILKSELIEAVNVYEKMAENLLTTTG